MNFNQLEAFYEVAQALSFTKAARKLHLTQPAVTLHVQNLEKFYSVQLFERLGKKILLTEAGKILFEFAANIFNLARQGEEAMIDFKGMRRGFLRIDAVVTFADYYLPGILAAFAQKHGGLTVAVNTGNTSQVVENTLNHKNDLAFVAYVSTLKENGKLFAQEFVRDRLVPVVRAGHPMTEKGGLSPRDLEDVPLLLREKGSSPRRYIDEFIEENKLSPRIALESGSTRAIKKAVEMGMGLAVLSYQAVREELNSGVLVQLEVNKLDLVYGFYLIHHKDKYFSKALQAFNDLARQTAALSLPGGLADQAKA